MYDRASHCKAVFNEIFPGLFTATTATQGLEVSTGLELVSLEGVRTQVEAFWFAGQLSPASKKISGHSNLLSRGGVLEQSSSDTWALRVSALSSACPRTRRACELSGLLEVSTATSPGRSNRAAVFQDFNLQGRPAKLRETGLRPRLAAALRAAECLPKNRHSLKIKYDNEMAEPGAGQEGTCRPCQGSGCSCSTSGKDSDLHGQKQCFN